MKRIISLVIVSFLVSINFNSLYAAESHGKTVKGGDHFSVAFTGLGKPYSVTASAATGWVFQGPTNVTNTINWYTDPGNSASYRWGQTKSASSDNNNELFSVRISGTIVPTGGGQGGGTPPPTDWSVKGTLTGDFVISPHEATAVKGEDTIVYNSLDGTSPVASDWSIESATGAQVTPIRGVLDIPAVTIGNSGHYAWSSFQPGTYYVKAKKTGSSETDEALLIVLDIFVLQNGLDITDTSHDEIIGAHIDFAGEIKPPVSISKHQWSIPGKKIKNYTIDSKQTTKTDFNANDLTKSQVAFYWIDAGEDRAISYSPTIASSSKTYTRSAEVSVKAPEYNNNMAMYPDNNIITVDKETYGFWRLFYGTEAEPGIRYQAGWLSDPTHGFGGDFKFAQRLDSTFRQATLLDGTKETPIQGANLCDVIFPYWTQVNGLTITSYDHPRSKKLADTYKEYSISDSFTTWVMYKPASENSIWVPIAKVNWFWQAVVKRNGEDWAFDGTPKHSSFAFGASTDEFPEWTGNTNDLINP